VTFSKDGKLTKSTQKGNFTSELDGYELTTAEEMPGGGRMEDTICIESVTEDALVLDFGQKIHVKRKKSKLI
jgi:hypothetical protein